MTRPENVHCYGTHTVDIAAELATLDTNGYRPLRVPQAQSRSETAPVGRSTV
jgi:hypothetical protein